MKIDGRAVENVLCNNCGSSDFKQLWLKDGFSYCQCKNCKLNFISPRLTTEEINKIYEVGFDSKIYTNHLHTIFHFIHYFLRQ